MDNNQKIAKDKIQMFKETRDNLASLNYPIADYADYTIASKKFLDDSDYGIEITGMNSAKIIDKAIVLSSIYKVDISRLISTIGIMRLPDIEIKNMVQLCASVNKGLLMAIGSSYQTDLGGFNLTDNGKLLGLRNRGMEGIVHAVEEVKRAIELGVRGFLVYDEGLLFLLNQMRAKNMFDVSDICIKYSVNGACCNPISAKLLAENGADTINLMPDVSLDMISSFRKITNIPFDIFTDTSKSGGSFIRTYEIPQIIKLASPVYLKVGTVASQGLLPNDNDLDSTMKHVSSVVDCINKYIPEAKRVGISEPTLSIPKV